jgi:hypothetical protein
MHATQRYPDMPYDKQDTPHQYEIMTSQAGIWG